MRTHKAHFWVPKILQSRRFFDQNRRFWGLMTLKSYPHHLYVQKMFLEDFGPFLASKKFLGCGAHPHTHFRPSENSVVGVFIRKKCYFCKFLAVSVKHPNGFLQDTLQVLRAQGSKKSRKMPKSIFTHQAHPFWDISIFCFSGPQKATFWRKVLLFCALWVQILVWGAPKYFSRKVWSKKMILHTLDAFQWSKLMPTQLFELGYFSRFLRVLRQYFL